jgi:hypothetical protein
MPNKISNKNITIEKLAQMVAQGFEDITSKMATKKDLELLATKIDLDKAKSELKQEIQGLRNAINNFLKLTDKRYLELKNNQKILAKYLKIVIEKSKMAVNTKELEAILK